MTLLDAYALVALVADEAAAGEVETLLRSGECHVVPVNLAEAIDVCRRAHGLPAQEVRDALEPLTLSGALGIAASDASAAWLAADVRARHYHRKRLPLSLADCFLIAHAIAAEDALATADPAVAEVARAETVRVVALPDRAGELP